MAPRTRRSMIRCLSTVYAIQINIKGNGPRPRYNSYQERERAHLISQSRRRTIEILRERNQTQEPVVLMRSVPNMWLSSLISKRRETGTCFETKATNGCETADNPFDFHL
eukprot:246919-Rhodomonas_salina.3